MIVRIMTENQYRMTDDQMHQVDQLDNDLEAALRNNDVALFRSSLAALTDYIRQSGELVPIDELVPSDVIVPAPDMSLEEAREHFKPFTVPPA